MVFKKIKYILDLIFRETQSMQNLSVTMGKREKKLKIKIKKDLFFLSGDIFHPAFSLSVSHSKIRQDPNGAQSIQR